MMTATRLVAVLVGLAIVSGCAGGAPPADPTPLTPPSASAPATERYTDAKNGFSIVPPAQWHASPNTSANPVVTFYRLPPDPAGGAPFPVNMVVAITGTTEGLDENLAAARQQLPEVLPNYQIVTDESTHLADGTPAHLLGGTYTDQGVQLRNIQLVVVVNGSSYVVTVTAPAASFDTYQDAARSSFQTFSPRAG